MIKVMFLPLNFHDVVQQGVCDAFEQAGCKLNVFDYFKIKEKLRSVGKVRKELIDIVGSFKPDLLHLQIQHTTIIDWKTIRDIKRQWPKIIIVNMTQDVRNYVPKQYKAIAQHADYNFIPNTSQLDMYRRAIGNNVYYWQIGYDPKIYYPPNKNLKSFFYDAVFIANYTKKDKHPGTPTREKVCKLLHSKFNNRFGLFGSGWPATHGCLGSLHQRKLAETYHQSFCAISVNHYNELDHYFSDRLLMCMACGRPTISFRFPKWETYFIDNCDLVIADSIEDVPKKVQYLLDNRDLAEYIGKCGAEKVMAEHTYQSRINELLKIIDFK